MEPAAPEDVSDIPICGVGVLDWRRHWRVITDNGLPRLVQPGSPVSGGLVGTVAGVRLVVAVDTLLGPEKTNTCSGCGVARCGVWVVFSVATAAWPYSCTGM